ncbi:MAG: PASTA domain-containing protein [Bacteroidia bacterium]|nr:PASTA domain-containing protein [Bacteroidia bacterium]
MTVATSLILSFINPFSKISIVPLTYLPNGSSVKIKESDWVVKDSTKSKLVATTIENGIIPDVRDMGLKDALYILENMGYRVTFSGKGKVTSQYPQPGTSLTRNQLVEIKLKEIYETE